MRVPAVLLCLALLAPLALAPSASAIVVEAPRWGGSGGVGALTDVGNGVLSVGGGWPHLRNVVYPAGNTFLEVTGGGETYMLGYNGVMVGLFHGGMSFGDYAPLDAHTLAKIDTTVQDGVTVVAAARVAPSATPVFTLSYWIHNGGAAPLTGVTLTEIVEPNANSANEETTAFDAQLGATVSQNAHGAAAKLAVLPCQATIGHAIGSDAIFFEVSQGIFNGAASYTGDSWLAHGLALGTIAPGEIRQVDFVFRLAASGGSVADAASWCPPPSAPPLGFEVPDLAIVGFQVERGFFGTFAQARIAVRNVGSVAAPAGSAEFVTCPATFGRCSGVSGLSVPPLGPGQTTLVTYSFDHGLAAGAWRATAMAGAPGEANLANNHATFGYDVTPTVFGVGVGL